MILITTIYCILVFFLLNFSTREIKKNKKSFQSVSTQNQLKKKITNISITTYYILKQITMLLRRNKYHFKKTLSAKKFVNSKLQWCLPLYRSIPMVHFGNKLFVFVMLYLKYQCK